jgi:hypothetical protein
MTPEVDFVVANHGSIWQFTPVTERAICFAETELGLEEWQWMGKTFCIDHRPARDLVESLADEGFLLRR